MIILTQHPYTDFWFSRASKILESEWQSKELLIPKQEPNTKLIKETEPKQAETSKPEQEQKSQIILDPVQSLENVAEIKNASSEELDSDSESDMQVDETPPRTIKRIGENYSYQLDARTMGSGPTETHTPAMNTDSVPLNSQELALPSLMIKKSVQPQFSAADKNPQENEADMEITNDAPCKGLRPVQRLQTMVSPVKPQINEEAKEVTDVKVDVEEPSQNTMMQNYIQQMMHMTKLAQARERELEAAQKSL